MAFDKASLLRMKEPYHFQRETSSIHSSYPRAAQPNTSQPNQKFGVKLTTQQQYWHDVYDKYMQGRGQ